MKGGETKPDYLELIGIVTIGAFHVITELATSVDVSRVYNAAATVLVIGYLFWKAARNKDIWRTWGFRVDNIWQAVKVQSVFAIPALICLWSWGWLQGTRSVPATFWVALAAYILLGTAQQFALQNLLARNLKPLIPNAFALACVSSMIFSLSHLPRYELVALAMLAGFFLTLGHGRCANLWVTGVVHGLLGAVAFYLLFEQDSGAKILQRLREVIAPYFAPH